MLMIPLSLCKYQLGQILAASNRAPDQSDLNNGHLFFSRNKQSESKRFQGGLWPNDVNPGSAFWPSSQGCQVSAWLYASRIPNTLPTCRKEIWGFIPMYVSLAIFPVHSPNFLDFIGYNQEPGLNSATREVKILISSLL